MNFAAVVAAAGTGLRMGGGVRKQYLFLGEEPVLARSLNLFLNHPRAGRVIAVIPPGDSGQVMELLKPYCKVSSLRLVEGGSSRQESVNRGLAAVPEDAGLVCIHDAARPLASSDLLDALLQAAEQTGAAVPVIPPSDTVKAVDGKGQVLATLKRDKLRLVQTPQVFKRCLILEAYRSALQEGLEATDDAALVEHLGRPVAAVNGEPANLKITTSRDLDLAEQFLKGAKRQ